MPTAEPPPRRRSSPPRAPRARLSPLARAAAAMPREPRPELHLHPWLLVVLALIAPTIAFTHERWVPNTPRFPVDRAYFQSMTGEVLLFSLLGSFANLAGEKSPAGKKSADAIINCLTTICGTDTACGTPEKVTWDNFAAEFMEDHCNGCHFPGFSGWNAKGVKKFVGPNAGDIPQFTNDADWASWGVPQGNPEWRTLSSFELVSAKIVADRTWCGVSVTLPDFCATEFSGEFPNAQRFPPKGVDLNVPDPKLAPSCVWTADGSCPQPTDVERNKMVSWVSDGTPK